LSRPQTDPRANPLTRAPAPQRTQNPLTRTAPQETQGFFPPAPQIRNEGRPPRAPNEPQQRVIVPNGGTRAFVQPSPIARPPQSPQPVYVQPIARPQIVHPVPQPAPAPAPAPAPHVSGGAPHPAPAQPAPSSSPEVRGR